MTTVLPILIPRTKNILLLKDDVGRPKPSTRRLPAESFTYGKPVHRDPDGIKQFSPEERPQRHQRTNRSDVSLLIHGKKNKPSTPFDRIFKQQYAEEARERLDNIYRERLQTDPLPPSFNKNRSFSLRQQYHQKKESKKIFKLKQFQDIKCRVYHNLIL